jgi:cytochrome b subunit of formate dehydrogenase|tara:strand:+ start:117 stop:377 length:261 start_codon:yes stop_codon:yes gene_type:complete
MDSFTRFTYWVAAIFFIGLTIVGFCMLFTLPAYLLWNWVMPIFGLPNLSIWQTMGLMMLCNILFGSYSIPSSNIDSFKDILKNKRK